jgi:ATP-dependent RNA helicase DeaD
MDQIKFSSISLSDELKRAVAEMGYDEATLIQSQSIPLILEGHDIIGRSQTGSGKTAAFALPAIDMLDTSLNRKTVQMLILCPTRELAVQAANEIRKFAKFKTGISVVPIYGGEQIGLQLSSLRQGCQIVVGTPGRVMDHMRRKTLRLQDVKMVVLDEADEMLNMGFVEDIETILSETPETRQTVLFSATMPASVLAITKKFQNNPQMVEIKQAQKTVATTEQFFFNTPKGQKTAALCRLLEYYKPTSSIIFCNTKLMVDELILELKKYGYHAQGLHGDMRQSARTQVMSQFKKGLFDILVATDVAARGIDVDDIKIVFNYDLPMDDEYYVHRIGRTGRAGKAGQAFTLIQGNRQLAQLRNTMRYTKCEILQKPLPTLAELKELQMEELCDKISAFMDSNDFSQYVPALERLTGEKYTATDIAAAMIAMTVKQKVQTDDIPANFNEFDMREEPFGRSPRNAGRNGPKRDGQNNPQGLKKREYNNENMTGIRISIGRKDRITPNHILGAAAGETGLPGKLFGAINIQDTYSTIDVPKEHKKIVVQKLNKSKINGKIITAE